MNNQRYFSSPRFITRTEKLVNNELQKLFYEQPKVIYYIKPKKRRVRSKINNFRTAKRNIPSKFLIENEYSINLSMLKNDSINIQENSNTYEDAEDRHHSPSIQSFVYESENNSKREISINFRNKTDAQQKLFFRFVNSNP